MWKSILLLLCLSGYCCAGPLGFKQRNMPILQREDEPMIVEPAASEESEAEKPAASPDLMMISTLTLPSNATSIRADITDGFSCENKTYGYYADIDNDCQIFHVCLPVTYADGKENTFRWSFICPEETVFSQDSFTCMRAEDMNIDCEDSIKYYELNRNFGMIDDESNKNTNNAATATNEDQLTATSSQLAQQQQPLAEEEKVETAPTVALSAQAKPVKQNEKPIKSQKPNRRKPSHPKKPATAMHPLRKIPQEVSVVTEVSSVQSVEPEQTIVAVKPVVVHKFAKRPALTTGSIKEKVQPVRVETPVTVRVESQSHKRKRPITNFNKKDTVLTKPAEEAAFVETKPEIVQIDETNLKLKPSVQQVTSLQQQETLSAVATVDKIETGEKDADTKKVTTTLETDADTQASETSAVFIKPVEVLKTTAEQGSQAEEQDIVKEIIAQAAEVPKPIESEKETTSETVVEQTNKIKQAQNPVEAIEEIPAVIADIEVSQPIVTADEKPQIETEEPVKIIEEHNASAQESAQQSVLDVTKPNPINEETAAPAIFEANSEEGSVSLPTLEELEEAKPVDAVESLPAVIEMEHQSPIVHDMFDELEDHKQSMGGFKPVDPVMAAEAEALITDFLNTLKRNDLMDAKPIMPFDMAEQLPAAAVADSQETKLETTEPEKTESQEGHSEIETDTEIKTVNEEKPIENETKPAENTLKLVETVVKPAENEKLDAFAETSDAVKTETAATETEKVETDAETPQLLKNDAPIASMLFNNFADPLYQIPVKVIETPAETPVEAPVTIVKADSEIIKEAEPELTEYKPLSIDDIVELVKERLDQKPTVAEMEVLPAESVETQEAVLPAEKTLAEKPVERVAFTEPQIVEHVVEPTENIVLPIYHRKQGVESADAPAESTLDAGVVNNVEPEAAVNNNGKTNLPTAEKAIQTEDGTVPAAVNIETDVVNTNSEDTETKTKTNRSYRSRSMKNAKMDPRKRRFLFRSDAS